MDDDPTRTIALWKLSVLGPLISVRLEHGDRLALLLEAAARTHQRPDGRLVQLSARTLEAAVLCRVTTHSGGSKANAASVTGTLNRPRQAVVVSM